MGMFSSSIGHLFAKINKGIQRIQNIGDAGLANDIGSWYNEITGTTENNAFSAMQAQMNRDFNANEAQKQRDFNANEAQRQREWEENMSNTAIQRQMADANAAGLNASLIYGGGAGITGANTPSGASASGTGASGSPASAGSGSGDPVSAIMNAINSTRMASAQIKNIDAQTNLMDEQSGKTRQETLFTLENTKLVKAQALETISRANLNDQERRNAEANLQKMYAEMEKLNEEIKILKDQGKITEVNAKFAKAEAIQRQIVGYIGALTGGISAVKGTSALPMTSNHNSNNVSWIKY